MDDLKPCPFCGGEAELIDSRLSVITKPVFYVECTSCNCIVGRRIMITSARKGKEYFGAKEDAIEAWNRRVSDESV